MRCWDGQKGEVAPRLKILITSLKRCSCIDLSYASHPIVWPAFIGLLGRVTSKMVCVMTMLSGICYFCSATLPLLSITILFLFIIYYFLKSYATKNKATALERSVLCLL